MLVWQWAQYQDPETEAAKWNSAIIHFIIYTCAYTVTHENVYPVEKVLPFFSYYCAPIFKKYILQNFTIALVGDMSSSEMNNSN